MDAYIRASISVGLMLMIPLVIAIKMYLRSSDGTDNGDLKLVVGRVYLFKHTKHGWMEGVYMGKDLDGYRQFTELDTGRGMSYQSSSGRAIDLVEGCKIKQVTQSPIPERMIDNKSEGK
jgi:hypothetical protein